MEKLTTSEDNDKKLSPFEKRVSRDVYTSFFLSQGAPLLQTLLFEYAFMIYPADELKKIDINNINNIIHNIKPPTRHTPIETQTLDTNEVAAFFDLAYGRAMENIEQHQLHYYDDSRKRLLMRILGGMVDRDLNFVVKGRDHETSKGDEQYDQHESLVRETLLKNKSVNSETFNQLLSELRQLLSESFSFNATALPTSFLEKIRNFFDTKHRTQMQVIKLKTEWEKNHENQKFDVIE